MTSLSSFTTCRRTVQQVRALLILQLSQRVAILQEKMPKKLRHQSGMPECFALPLIVSLTVVPVESASSKSCASKPDAATNGRLRSSVKVPGGWGNAPIPLAKYARHYAGVCTRGQRMIRGELILPDAIEEHVAGVYVENEADLPIVAGGGSSVANLLYAVKNAHVVWIDCNYIR